MASSRRTNTKRRQDANATNHRRHDATATKGSQPPVINREALLSDLQDLVQKLELDLIARSDDDSVPEVRDALNAEFKKATDAERTALSKEKWLNYYKIGYITG